MGGYHWRLIVQLNQQQRKKNKKKSQTVLRARLITDAFGIDALKGIIRIITIRELCARRKGFINIMFTKNKNVSFI